MADSAISDPVSALSTVPLSLAYLSEQASAALPDPSAQRLNAFIALGRS